MIWEWKSCSIVMLTELEERGQVSSKRSWTVGDRLHEKGEGKAKKVCLNFFFDLNCAESYFQAVLSVDWYLSNQLASLRSGGALWSEHSYGSQTVHTPFLLSLIQRSPSLALCTSSSLLPRQGRASEPDQSCDSLRRGCFQERNEQDRRTCGKMSHLFADYTKESNRI